MARLFKISEVAEVLEAKGELAALQFASRLNCLGTYRDAIQKGYAAHRNPSFYRQLGQNPEALLEKAIDAMRRMIDANETD